MGEYFTRSELSALLSTLLSPLFISILAFFIATLLIFHSRKLAIVSMLVGQLVLAAFSIPIVADGLLHSLENDYRNLGISDVPEVEYAILLGEV